MPEAAVGGVAGLAVVTLYIILESLAVGADAGDWLGFAGAIVGVGGAAGTAIYVEERKRRQSRRDDIRLLAGALQDLDQALEAFAPDVDHGPDLYRQREAILSSLERLNFGCELFAHARAASKIDDVTLWRLVRRVEQVIGDHVAMLEREAGIIDDYGVTEGILKVFRQKTTAFSERLKPLLAQALDRIDRI